MPVSCMHDIRNYLKQIQKTSTLYVMLNIDTGMSQFYFSLGNKISNGHLTALVQPETSLSSISLTRRMNWIDKMNK